MLTYILELISFKLIEISANTFNDVQDINVLKNTTKVVTKPVELKTLSLIYWYFPLSMYTIENDKITVTVIPTTTKMYAIVFNRFTADIYI